MLRKSILCISDQHSPYHHPDTIDFLVALNKKYKPDCIVNMGDELDWHSISFHDKHPGLYSPSDELAEAKQLIKTLQGQVSNLQYIKHKDYTFLVDENRRLEQELNEAKADNQKLSLQINEMVERLRDRNF